MTVLNKRDIQRPALEKETVEVPELGGEVVVQALDLPSMLELYEQGLSNARRMIAILHLCVVDNEGTPIFSVEEWGVWGAKNKQAALTLSEKAIAVSGIGDDEKKDQAPG